MFSGFARVARLFCDFVRVRLIFFSIKSSRICFNSFWAASRFWKHQRRDQFSECLQGGLWQLEVFFIWCHYKKAIAPWWMISNNVMDHLLFITWGGGEGVGFFQRGNGEGIRDVANRVQRGALENWLSIRGGIFRIQQNFRGKRSEVNFIVSRPKSLYPTPHPTPPPPFFKHWSS